MTNVKKFILLLSAVAINNATAQTPSYNNNSIVNAVNSQAPTPPLKQFDNPLIDLNKKFSKVLQANKKPLKKHKVQPKTSHSLLKQTLHKKIIGCYSEDGEKLSANSVCLFADGSFYYPTLRGITGKYQLTANKIRFFPNSRDIFEVYARYNPQLKNATEFNFSDFSFDSLINFDQEGFNYVPVEKSSCYWNPQVEVYNYPKKVAQFDLAYAPREQQASQALMTYSYKINSKVNDFLLIYNRPTISKTPALVISDEHKVWLQMGKNTVSLSRINMKKSDLLELQKVGHAVARTDNDFPKMLDENNNLTLQSTKHYFVDKRTNLLFPNEKKVDVISKGWQAYIKPIVQKGNTPYLKVYKKLQPVGQGMKQVALEMRMESPVNNCL